MAAHRIRPTLWMFSLVLAILLGTSPLALAQTPRCLGRSATKTGTAASETIKGTSGDDVIVGLGGNDVLIGKSGNDLICGGAGIDTLKGQSGNDSMVGGPLRDVIDPGAGDDRTDGSDGRDSISYASSKTSVTIQLAQQRATGAGNDVMKSIEDAAGSPFDDSIAGTEDRNKLNGGKGNDTIVGGGALDLVLGGPGNDSLEGGAARDVLYYRDSKTAVNVDLSSGAATGEGSDEFSGFEAVYDSAFADRITGTDENDFFVAAPGDDIYDGKGGTDGVFYWFAEKQVSVELGAGTATGLGSDSLAGIEGIWGGDFGNKLSGDAADNILLGGAGKDELYGRDGNDRLKGFLGDDVYDGGDGTYDKVDLSDSTAGVQADLTQGTATGEGSDTLSGIESMQGTAFDDALAGDAFDNFLFGLGGDDTLSGVDGNDFLDGGDGSDSSDGGPGEDGCSFTESPLNCEGEDVPPPHPQESVAVEVTDFKRNF